MADQISWLHSGGLDNKLPTYDLGGPASAFEIAVPDMNNLLPDPPVEDAVGLTDFRCFYLKNDYVTSTARELAISLTGTVLCGTACVGSVLANDVQRVIFDGDTPEAGGFVIFATEFGPPVTVYWPGSWGLLAAEMQFKLRQIPDCGAVTVALEGTLTAGAKYLVTFLGAVRHRRVEPIRVVQNNLFSVRGPAYRVGAVSGPNNGAGDTVVRVTQPITDLPAAGFIYVFNISTGVFDKKAYSGYSGTDFTITTPLAVDLAAGDEVWAEAADPQKACLVSVVKVTDGSPIRRTAPWAESEGLAGLTCGSALDLGMLRPTDECFVWVRRGISLTGCSESISLTLTGTLD